MFNKFTYKPKTVWDNDFLYRSLTREVITEKIPKSIKMALLNDWHRGMSVDFKINTGYVSTCMFCNNNINLQNEPAYGYVKLGSNKSLLVCFMCDARIYAYKTSVQKNRLNKDE